MNVDKLVQQITIEIKETEVKKAKELIKQKLLQIRRAEQIVANLKHEYDDLLEEIKQDIY